MKRVVVAMMAVALSGGLVISGFASNGDTWKTVYGDTVKTVHSDTLKAVYGDTVKTVHNDTLKAVYGDTVKTVRRDTLKAVYIVKSDTTDHPNDTTKRDTKKLKLSSR